ncbi:glycosyltransferase family 39 protein [uncultured Mucilaginibacter sp.]|uniref:ArnT family glycosyltransferase n=1 Tax=uncultured Mucilaginibacter sp. TaxID=797541 RepID=UPI0025FED902|nr:glycosyltransferase family 39 protein [uncultured Mucilaginibacter sp.]
MKMPQFKKLLNFPYLLFSPLLLYYSYLIKQNKWPSLYGDEVRYMAFAKNLVHGFYSHPAPNIDLWNGPGYPIILMPFVALHTPDLYTTLMNAVYLYLTVVFLYKSLSLLGNNTIALVCGLVLALYPNALAMLPILYTEALTGFLVSSFLYCVTIYGLKHKPLYMFISGLILGFLILTKVVFGYVIVVCIGACLLALMFKKNRVHYIKAIKILVIAFGISIPYLFYTYHITGKVFYWGNSGGMSLYWMSTPYDNEYGDWKLPDLTNKQYPTLFKSAETVVILKKNHSQEVSAILKHNPIQQDSLFKRAAVVNIKAHPSKFLSNYINNISRMLFNFPYSYSYQDAAIVRNIVIGSSILWASLIALILTLLNWRKIAFPVKMTLLITTIYLLLSAALSAYPRQLDVVMPVLLFWIGYMISKLPKPEMKFPA